MWHNKIRGIFIGVTKHTHLMRLGDSKAGSAVGQLDVQLLGTLEDLNTVAGADAVGNLGRVGASVHHEHLQLGNVADDDLSQTVRHNVLGGLVGTVTNLGHRELALEAASDAVVNTLRLSPCLLDSLVTVRLMSLEDLGSLLDNDKLLG